MSKAAKVGLGLLFIVAAVIGVTVWRNRPADLRQREDELRRQMEEAAFAGEVRAIAAKLCAEHGAVPGWAKPLPQRNLYFEGLHYTIDVQSALIRDDGKPLLMFCSVEDLRRDDAQFTAVLVGAYFSSSSSHEEYSCVPITFELQCDADQASRLSQLRPVDMMSGNEVDKAFAEIGAGDGLYWNIPAFVVAEITAVARKERDADEASAFVARGKCVDFRAVGQPASQYAGSASAFGTGWPVQIDDLTAVNRFKTMEPAAHRARSLWYSWRDYLKEGGDPTDASDWAKYKAAHGWDDTPDSL